MKPVLVLSLLSACSVNLPDDDPKCGGDVTVEVTSQTPDVVESDLLVHGTVTPTSSELTVRSLTVGGIQAEPDTFNFGEWTATVPFPTLLALKANASTPDDVMLPIVAATGCRDTGELEIPVRLNRHPGVKVTGLSLTASFPANRTYLPADGSASGVLQIEANAEARGAVVTLDAGTEIFPGGATSWRVILAGDGISGAGSNVLLTASDPKGGSAFITALSQGFLAKSLSFVLATAPRIVPAAGSLRAGQSLRISVETDTPAQQTKCAHFGDTGIEVLGEEDAASFQLKVADPLESAATVIVSCQDGYGQLATARFDAAP